MEVSHGWFKVTTIAPHLYFALRFNCNPKSSHADWEIDWCMQNFWWNFARIQSAFTALCFYRRWHTCCYKCVTIPGGSPSTKAPPVGQSKWLSRGSRLPRPRCEAPSTCPPQCAQIRARQARRGRALRPEEGTGRAAGPWMSQDRAPGCRADRARIRPSPGPDPRSSSWGCWH